MSSMSQTWELKLVATPIGFIPFKLHWYCDSWPGPCHDRMAAVPLDQISPEQKDELLCTYAALVLHDDGAEITPAAMTNLIKAAGCSVEAYWPLLMARKPRNHQPRWSGWSG